jgi:hypothetical protein
MPIAADVDNNGKLMLRAFAQSCQVAQFPISEFTQNGLSLDDNPRSF